MEPVEIHVKAGDALTEFADVLVLKYAQESFGVDYAVVQALNAAGRTVPLPKPWSFRIESSVGGIAAARFLFIGVPALNNFGYREIRMFARKAMSSLAGEVPHVRHVMLTVHGAGYGLDEFEAFEAEIAGLVDAVHEQDYPRDLRSITIIERNEGRANRLSTKLIELLPGLKIDGADKPGQPNNSKSTEVLHSAGYASNNKACVFVAMPFKDEMDDIYHYGIQSAVNAAGFLCERADLSVFSGDVMEWVRLRIRSSSLVVADLSEANPNVYLEVGYAWGIGVPTILVVRSTEHLQFDVRGHRCLVYKKIKELEHVLTKELTSLTGKPC
jgi:hypothetical protein